MDQRVKAPLSRVADSPFAPFRQKAYEYKALEAAEEKLYAHFSAHGRYSYRFATSKTHALAEFFSTFYMDGVRAGGRNHFLTTTVEDAPILLWLKRLEEKYGCKGKSLPVQANGQLKRQDLWEAISPRTGLVSISYANALTGVIQPIDDLVSACYEHEVPFHVDVSSAYGIVPLDLDADFITFKGGLFAKEPPAEFCLGGDAIDAASLLAFGDEAAQLQENITTAGLEMGRLRSKLEREIEKLPGDQVVHFTECDRLPSCAVISFRGIASELLLYHLSERGVFANFGGGSSQKLGHLMRHGYGLDEALASCALSFQLSPTTQPEEIDYALDVLSDVLPKLRKLSGALV